MKVMILGGGGMAGHMISDVLLRQGTCEVISVIRGVTAPNVFNVDVTDESAMQSMISDLHPDVVINAAGILTRQAEANPLSAIKVNSVLPRWLACQSQSFGYRLIHISTDCVFSGSRGGYVETDIPDGTTVYARTKVLGEVVSASNLTIRTSIIGPELKQDGTGLFHWFMNQAGQIQGYQNVFWNGVTTLTLAQVVCQHLASDVNGLVHLCGRERISKFTLLRLIQDVFGRKGVNVVPTATPVNDKSLIATRPDFTPTVPGYGAMLTQLREWMDGGLGKRRYGYA